MPRKIVIVPSVTTIGGISSFHTKMPLIAPRNAPRNSEIAIITGTGRSGAATLIIAQTMPVRARFAATDRSIQRVRITTICPSARMISGEVSVNTPIRFDGATKPANRVEINARSARMAPKRIASRDLRKVMPRLLQGRCPLRGAQVFRGSGHRPAVRRRCGLRASR